MNRKLSLLIALALGGTACSRTAPESQWPPPGPKDGLPFIPLPESDEEASEPEAAATAPEAPVGIDGALPSAPPASLARHHKCAETLCRLPKLVPDVAFAKAVPSGADSPGTFWLEQIDAGKTVVLPRQHRAEVLAVLVEGSALASGDEGGAAVELDPWRALRAPGAGITLKAGESGAKLVLGVAATRGNVSDVVSDLEKKAWEVRWKQRPQPLVSVGLVDAKNHSWGANAFHARIAFGGETPIAGSLETLMTSPSALIKEHDHESWEHIAILEGEGTMKLSGKDHPVTAGAVFDIPPGEKHSFTPAGTKPLLAVQMYTPSGAEQRFVKLAEAAAAAAAEAPKK